MNDVTRPTVFICYSHEDERFKDELLSHLRVLEHEGSFDVWVDSRILAGDDWFKTIEAAIRRAKVAIILVSQHLLNSAFVRREEIPRLLEGRRESGLRVLPVIVRECPWQRVPWLASIQARKVLVGASRRDRIYTAIVDEVAELLETAGVVAAASEVSAGAWIEDEDPRDGYWLKISERGAARVVKLHSDLSLQEWNLFDIAQSWGAIGSGTLLAMRWRSTFMSAVTPHISCSSNGRRTVIGMVCQ